MPFILTLILLQLTVADLRVLAPFVDGERWASLEIRAVAPVGAWTALGLQPGDKVQLFNSHAMDVTTAEAFYAWSVSPATSVGIAVRRGGKMKWIHHRIGRPEEPRIRAAMRGQDMVGIEVLSVPASAFWASIGLRAGDVIVAVDGITLTHPLALVVAFNSKEQKFRIRRGDEEFDLPSSAFFAAAASAVTEPAPVLP